MQQTEPYAKTHSSFDRVLIWTENFQKQPFGRKQLGGRVEEKVQNPISNKQFWNIWLCFPPCFPCWSHWMLAAVWKNHSSWFRSAIREYLCTEMLAMAFEMQTVQHRASKYKFCWFLHPPPPANKQNISHQHIHQWAQGLQIQAKPGITGTSYITSGGRGSYSTSGSTPQGH